ncbi:hypothetical protein QTP86_030297, partial [Hemibagrus guttatus]
MPEEPEPILPPDLFVCPITWSLDDDIRAATEEEPAPDGKAYVPTSLRLSLLDSVLASLGSGHPGRQRTLSLLKEQYWWPNMAKDVTRFVRGCSVCAMVSTSRCLPEGKLVPIPIPHCPWSHLGIDFATDLPVSNVFTTILVTVDCFSCKLIPLKGLPTALETVEALFSNIFRHFGIPEDIVSDRGLQFISRVWRGFFKLLGVSVSLSSGYHPQTTGQTERKIQEIGHYLRAYCHDHQHDWTSVHSRVPATSLSVVSRTVRGDKVWLSTRDIRLQLPCKKLSPRYIGPFTILRQINNVTYELQLSRQYHISPTFHVSLLKPFIDPVLPLPTEPEVPPPPEIDTDDTIYQVGGEVLPQVEEFKYLGVLFTSEGRMEQEIDRQISAVAWASGEVFRARPREAQGRPRTRWRDYVYQLTWEHLRIPPEELEEVSRERK